MSADPDSPLAHLRARNRRTAWAVALTVVAMAGLSFAAVPMYRLFCKVTGFGGTTQVSATAPGAILDRTIVVRFDSATDPRMPWQFGPDQRSVTVRLGERALVSYHARNTADREVTGTAVYNVTPLKAGKYFNKMECFCFGLQTLAPRQNATLPVAFYIDPAMDRDPNMADVTTITLSYTFFRADSPELEKAMERFYNE